MAAIPKQVALQLCQEIREENPGRRLSFARMQCWGLTVYGFSLGQRVKLP